MNTALAKIQARTKQLRKSHPKMKYTDVVKKASKELRAEGKIGVVKKKPGVTVKRKAPAAKKVTAKTIRTTVNVGSVGAIGAIARGRAIYKNIDKMEAQFKKEKRPEMKRIIAVAINAEHDKLDKLTKRK